jgi:outer membrane protein assembly factor BamB
MVKICLFIVALFFIINISDFSASLSNNQFFNTKVENNWPMFCHDAHHTSRSEYEISSNVTLKWSFPTSMMGCYGSTAIDSNGTLYLNAGDLFAITSKGNLKWIYSINGYGETTPVISHDGTIYFSSTSGGDPSHFCAVNPDGTTKWTYLLWGGYGRSSPAIGSDETIYFGFENRLIALNPNGTLQWSFYALYPNGTLRWQFKTDCGIGVSPCIGDDGIVYFVSTDEYLYALYPNNGTMKWKTNVYAGTSPTIGSDGTIYAGWDKLHAIDSRDGSIKWEFTPGGYIEGGTPCTSKDGTIFFGTTSGDFIAVNPDGTEKWRIKIGVCESAPAIGSDGTIYVGSMDEDGFGYLNAIGPGEPKKIEIINPLQGRISLFGFDLCHSPMNKTIIIGRTKVKVKVYQENELQKLVFKINGKTYCTLIKQPYEWTMNERFSDKANEKLSLTVIAYYNGNYSYSVTLPINFIHVLRTDFINSD